ncbi:MAG: 3-methyl-2-oxobutanoate hydroxymethyltransferase [Spirochaetaceae bacterium]|nr:3-methyl-2-oxobutanoate hydroxymethyltransferase [Spirochaetaceae bacterium]
MKGIDKKKLLPDNYLEMKQEGKKIAMVTAYTYYQAMAAQEAGVDIILVGDSLGMVELGYDSTIPVTMEDMMIHLKAVRRGSPNIHVAADMPFLSFSVSTEKAIENAGAFYQKGLADSVKIEGGAEYAGIINSICKAGIPVCAHIGLTPQTSALLGGLKVQGKTLDAAKKLIDDAIAVQEAGAFMVVVEAVPAALAAIITKKLSIPTIGIGGGISCDGQVLVFHDMVGLYKRFTPKFVKVYANVYDIIEKAIEEYVKDVKEGNFPEEKHSFTMKKEIIDELNGII